MTNILFLLLFGVIGASHAKLQLSATGGDTYNLINGVFGGTAYEVPDCAHSAFGQHIKQEYDSDLGRNAFAFYLHVTPDNDRCIKFDRQRNEVKLYDKTDAAYWGTERSTFEYSWMMKLDAAFQTTNNFAHVHQLKAKGGDNDGSPIMTLTPRGNQLTLEYWPCDGCKSQRLLSEPLQPFLGTWLRLWERAKFTNRGSKYALEIRRASDNKRLLNFKKNGLKLWRDGAQMVRPKWGLYRSLADVEGLRDERVLFNDFCVSDNGGSCP